MDNRFLTVVAIPLMEYGISNYGVLYKNDDKIKTIFELVLCPSMQTHFVYKGVNINTQRLVISHKQLRIKIDLIFNVWNT